MFQEQARTVRFNVVQSILGHKQQENGYVSSHALKFKGYLDFIERLGFPFTHELAINVILISLTSSYKQFTMTYCMNDLEKRTMEPYGILKIPEERIVSLSNTSSTSPLLAIREAGS
uniref:Uncharacterized protein n=1 Tax=Lactuca sativa TaxID=4236 RepID=A0A9R1UFA8_LACSA|nr:hypothetical protein LSAT_V11C900490460 [Lactuca sativa]